MPTFTAKCATGKCNFHVSVTASDAVVAIGMARIAHQNIGTCTEGVELSLEPVTDFNRSSSFMPAMYRDMSPAD